MHTMPKRLEANRAIVAKLAELVERNPDMRFHQLLQSVGVEKPPEDQFYEESEQTLQNLQCSTSK